MAGPPNGRRSRSGTGASRQIGAQHSLRFLLYDNLTEVRMRVGKLCDYTVVSSQRIHHLQEIESLEVINVDGIDSLDVVIL